MNSKKILLLIDITLVATSFTQAQKLPAKKEVMDKMVLANACFMNKWPDTGKSIVRNRERPSNIQSFIDEYIIETESDIVV